MRILFIGATGMLGKPVATQLIAAGFDVTLLARDANKMEKFFPGIKIVQGDVFDKESLRKAFPGHDAVYLNLSINQSSKNKDPQTEREGIDNIIAVAKETGIKRLVYLSSLVHFYQGMNGFDWWAFRIKEEAIKKIKNSGIDYTIFYPSTFMETYPYQMIMGKRVGMMGKSLMPMWFIAAEDYGKQVARSFETAGSENKEYPVQGLYAYTFEEATRIFIENYSKNKLSIMRAPFGLVKFFGSFSPKMNYVWHICEALNKYPEKFESEITWHELGKPTITFADFTKSL